MIYRKWSLLTLPVALGGAGAAVSLVTLVAFDINPFSTIKKKTPDSIRSEAAAK